MIALCSQFLSKIRSGRIILSVSKLSSIIREDVYTESLRVCSTVRYRFLSWLETSLTSNVSLCSEILTEIRSERTGAGRSTICSADRRWIPLRDIIFDTSSHCPIISDTMFCSTKRCWTMSWAKSKRIYTPVHCQVWSLLVILTSSKISLCSSNLSELCFDRGRSCTRSCEADLTTSSSRSQCPYNTNLMTGKTRTFSGHPTSCSVQSNSTQTLNGTPSQIRNIDLLRQFHWFPRWSLESRFHTLTSHHSAKRNQFSTWMKSSSVIPVTNRNMEQLSESSNPVSTRPATVDPATQNLIATDTHKCVKFVQQTLREQAFESWNMMMYYRALQLISLTIDVIHSISPNLAVR